MKITILKQNIKDEVAMNKGIEEAKAALLSINFPVEIIIRNSLFNFTTQSFSNSAIGQGYCVVPEQILAEVDGTDDVAFLIFNNENMNPKPLNPLQTPIKKGNTTPCQMCEEWYNDFDNVFEEFFVHELCHAVYFLTGQSTVDKTHMKYDPQWNGQFNQKQNMDYYLFIINSLMPAWTAYKSTQNTMPPTYKYFKMTESTGGGHTFSELTPELRQLLDTMRGECGFPFRINSGVRSVAQNASLSDAVSDSAHLSGLAVDISITDSSKRYTFNKVAYAHGITRIGLGKDFVHIDISKTLPQNVEWTYY